MSPSEEGWRQTGLGEREKPLSQSAELGHGSGVCRRHASIPHAPRGCGSALETGAARRRQVDYHSQKAARGCAYWSQQYLRARLFFFYPLLSSLLPPRAKLQFPEGFARRRLGSGQPGSHSGHPSWRCLQRTARSRTLRSWGPRGGQPGRPGLWVRVQGRPHAGLAGNRCPLGPRGSARAGDPADGRVWAPVVGGGGAGTRALRTWPDLCLHGSTFETSYQQCMEEHGVGVG